MFGRECKIALVVLLLSGGAAQAQLSANPWVDPNSKEAVSEVYQKDRSNNAPLAYSGDNTVLEERPVYVNVPKEDASSDDGMLARMKKAFSKEKPQQSVQQAPVQRRVVSGGKKISRTRRSGAPGADNLGDMSDFGFDFSGMVRKLRNYFNASLNAVSKEFR